MQKIVLGVAAGFVAAALLAGIIGACGAYFFPPFPPVDMNPELIRTMGEPVLTTLVKLLGWAVGAFAGGMLAMRIAEQDIWPAVAVGALLGLLEIVRLFLVPHQVAYVALVFAFIGVATFGAAWVSTHGTPGEEPA